MKMFKTKLILTPQTISHLVSV